jgi:hypothetical protein
MQTLELLLAFQLRSLAADLHSTARAGYYASIFATNNEAERRAKLEAWEKEHPIKTFIPIALEEVEQIAEHLRELLGEGSRI